MNLGKEICNVADRGLIILLSSHIFIEYMEYVDVGYNVTLRNVWDIWTVRIA